MSSAQGFPDWQRITQWLGPPIITETGRVIGAGTITDGPYQVSNFASVIVAIKPTIGNVTVTIKQTVPAGPASLVLTSSVVVPAGATLFEAFVLYGGAVELDLTGSVAGTTVDYALYGSNTTTNAQVITAATVDIQHNDVLVAAEPALDFEDALGFVWSIVDDGPNQRMKITPAAPAMVKLADTTLAVAAATIDLQNISQQYTHLRLLALLRDDTGTIGFAGGASITYNGDAGANYSYHYLQGNAGAASSGGLFGGNSYAGPGCMGGGSGTNRFGIGEVVIPGYTDAGKRKMADIRTHGIGANTAQSNTRLTTGYYDVLAAISRITLAPPAGGNFVAGSRVALFGWS